MRAVDIPLTLMSLSHGASWSELMATLPGLKAAILGHGSASDIPETKKNLYIASKLCAKMLFIY